MQRRGRVPIRAYRATPIEQPLATILRQPEIDPHMLDAGVQGLGRDSRQVGNAEVAANLIIEIHRPDLSQKDRTGKWRVSPARVSAEGWRGPAEERLALALAPAVPGNKRQPGSSSRRSIAASAAEAVAARKRRAEAARKRIGGRSDRSGSNSEVRNSAGRNSADNIPDTCRHRRVDRPARRTANHHNFGPRLQSGWQSGGRPEAMLRQRTSG